MAEQKKPQIHDSWLVHLRDEFNAPYFSELKSFLKSEKMAGKTIYPPEPQIFNAFNSCAFEKVKVVIIGQDPYHGAGQAHGLSFSVLKGVKTPPSLRNIFSELKADLACEIPPHGELSSWAENGVLLLNAVLTVEAASPASHQKKGWENFTDSAIKALSEKRENLVFMLWGRFAQSKKELINSSRHLILEAAHPSPYSANNGFFGCRHFSKANQYLQNHGLEGVNWEIEQD